MPSPTIRVTRVEQPKSVWAQLRHTDDQDLSSWVSSNCDDLYACDDTVVKQATDTIQAPSPFSRLVRLLFPPQRAVWTNVRVPRSDELSYHDIDIVILTPSQLFVLEFKDWQGEVHPTKGEWVMFKEPHKESGWVQVDGRKDEWMVIRPDGSRTGRNDPLVEVAAKADLLFKYLQRTMNLPDAFPVRKLVVFTNPNCILSPALRDLDEIVGPSEWKDFLAVNDWDGPPPNPHARPSGVVSRMFQSLFARHSSGSRSGKLSPSQFQQLRQAMDALPTWDVITFRNGRRILGDLIRYDNGKDTTTTHLVVDELPPRKRPLPPPPPPDAFHGEGTLVPGDKRVVGTAAMALTRLTQRSRVSKVEFHHQTGFLRVLQLFSQVVNLGGALEVTVKPVMRPNARHTFGEHNLRAVAALLTSSISFQIGRVFPKRLVSGQPKKPDTKLDGESGLDAQHGLNGSETVDQVQQRTSTEKQSRTNEAEVNSQTHEHGDPSQSREDWVECSVPLDTQIVFRPAGSAETKFTCINAVASLELSKNPVAPRFRRSSTEGDGDNESLLVGLAKKWLG